MPFEKSRNRMNKIEKQHFHRIHYTYTYTYFISLPLSLFFSFASFTVVGRSNGYFQCGTNFIICIFHFMLFKLPLLPLYTIFFFFFWLLSLNCSEMLLHPFQCICIFSISWVSFPSHWSFFFISNEVKCFVCSFLFVSLIFQGFVSTLVSMLFLCVPNFPTKKMHFILPTKKSITTNSIQIYKSLWHAAYYNTHLGYFNRVDVIQFIHNLNIV